MLIFVEEIVKLTFRLNARRNTVVYFHRPRSAQNRSVDHRPWRRTRLWKLGTRVVRMIVGFELEVVRKRVSVWFSGRVSRLGDGRGRHCQGEVRGDTRGKRVETYLMEYKDLGGRNWMSWIAHGSGW